MKLIRWWFLPLFALLFSACAPAAVAPAALPSAQPTSTSIPLQPSLTVSDQDASEGRVMVEQIVSRQPGWVVIHNLQAGAPGAVIGFAPLAAGETTQVEVEIDLALASGDLLAMLHIDAGTPGTFEFPGADLPLQVGEEGISQLFTITFPIELALSVSDQDVSDGSVLAVGVRSNETGWLVIHSLRDNAPGPVIGYQRVQRGYNAEVSIPIDLNAATRQLYGMLHIDAGVLGEFEFPGADLPQESLSGQVLAGFKGSFVIENALVVSDHDYQAGIVTIEHVSLVESGWLVIHKDARGSPGAVLGFAQVAVGNNPDLPVLIDFSAATPTLFAMVHVDAGALGEYEFPGPDVPLRVEGVSFTLPFNLLVEPVVLEASVMVLDTQFSPASITVPLGTTVVWQSNADLPHTVTADDGGFDSGTLRSGKRFSRTFSLPGTYPYYCDFHGGPGGSGMAGVVIVTE